MIKSSFHPWLEYSELVTIIPDQIAFAELYPWKQMCYIFNAINILKALEYVHFYVNNAMKAVPYRWIWMTTIPPRYTCTRLGLRIVWIRWINESTTWMAYIEMSLVWNKSLDVKFSWMEDVGTGTYVIWFLHSAKLACTYQDNSDCTT